MWFMLRHSGHGSVHEDMHLEMKSTHMLKLNQRDKVQVR